jgi:hypothetical protein
MLIQLAGPPCGSGKTYSCAQICGGRARGGQRILILAPSKALCQSVHREVVSAHKDIEVSVIVTTNEDGQTVRRLSERLQQRRPLEDGGEIVIGTHQAWSRLPPELRGKGEWDLVIDEALSVDYHEQINLARNRDFILDLVGVETFPEPERSSYYRLVARNRSMLKEIINDKSRDHWWSYLKGLAMKVMSDNWLIATPKRSWDEFSDGRQTSLTVSGFLEPSILRGWRSVTYMSAVVRETMAARIWSRYPNVKMRDHWTIKGRFQQHQNGDLLSIYYAQENHNTKGLRERLIDGRSQEAHNVDRINELFGGEPSVVMANVGVDPGIVNAARLPNIPHGLNSYQQTHNAAVLSALNPSPAHYGFLRDVAGLSEEDVRSAVYYQAVYQAICRISLRDLSDRNRKRVVVIDNQTALWVQKQFSGSTVELLPGYERIREVVRDSREPKPSLDTATRIINSRQGKTARLIDEFIALQNCDFPETRPNRYGGVSGKSQKHLTDLSLLAPLDVGNVFTALRGPQSTYPYLDTTGGMRMLCINGWTLGGRRR